MPPTVARHDAAHGPCGAKVWLSHRWSKAMHGGTRLTLRASDPEDALPCIGRQCGRTQRRHGRKGNGRAQALTTLNQGLGRPHTVHENQSGSCEGNGPNRFLIGEFVGQNSIGHGLRDQRLAGLQDLQRLAGPVRASPIHRRRPRFGTFGAPRTCEHAPPRALRRSPAMTKRHQMNTAPLCTLFVVRNASGQPSTALRCGPAPLRCSSCAPGAMY